MSIKKGFISSVFYMALAKYSNVIIQLIITGVLARILAPEDFGAVAISTVLIAFFQLLSDVGFSPAIIQNKKLSKDDLNGIFSACLYIGMLISLIVFVLSSAIASFYAIDVLQNIFRLLCLCSLFTCLNIVPEALLKREKRFRFISIRTVIVNTISGGIAIICAYGGLGVYSLLVMPILSIIIIFIINYLQKPLRVISLTQCRRGVSKVWNYSIYQFMYNFLYYISRNLDKLVVGKTLGTIPLGYYEKSYHLMLTPVSNLSSVVTPTIQPFFAERQNDKEWMFNGCCKILHFLSLISFPLSAFCFFSAREIILLIFGPQWEMAVTPFQILSLSIGFQVIYSPQGAFYQAANSTKRLFTSNIVVAALNLIAIIIGAILFRSIDILCYGIVVSFLFSFGYVYCILVKKLYGKSFLSFLKVFIKPTLIALIMAVVLYIIPTFVNATDLILSLVIKVVMSMIVYTLSLYFSKEYRYLDIRRK